MTDKKISELTNITGADVDDASDELPIVDASTNTTKAITRGELFKGVDSATFDNNVTIGGNLTVNGTTVTIDTTTLDVSDKNITVAKDAPDATSADGAGITVDGANATITYGSVDDTWDFNKGISTAGDIEVTGTVDGRDVAADGSKLDGIEAGATADQTAGEIKTAYESNADTNAFTDAEQSKLSGIETGADVTDTTNVTAAGALMDSELTSEASVKALDQGVATTDSPEFAGLTVDTDTLYVDSANNRVGIGVSAPSVTLDVVAPTANAKVAEFSGVNAGRGLAIKTFNENGFDDVGVNYETQSAVGEHSFSIGSSEAMRIDSSGNLLVGTTVAAGNKTHISFDPSSQNGMRFSHSSGTYTNSAIVFVNASGVTVGSIKTNGYTTSYNTSSDERLKENITDADDASAVIDGIQVRQFDWKADGEHQRYGMIAQELDAVAPEAVTKGETEDDMWSVDYSKLVPMLVKEIQDLRKRVEELETSQ
jgi:hypothetical protein